MADLLGDQVVGPGELRLHVSERADGLRFGHAEVQGAGGATAQTLRRPLPSWGNDEDGISGPESSGTPEGFCRVGGAVVRPVAFGCPLCAARRTGQAVRGARYAERWERVCGRHGRWLLDADADQPLED